MASVLIVDDEAGIRSFLRAALKTEGHTLDEAQDGEAALRAVAAHAYHVVVTDLKMPGLSGLELLARLRADWPEIEVIVLTAHGTVESAVQAMKLGAFDYLSKPLGSPAEIRLLVERALERHRLRARTEATAPPPGPNLGYGAPAMEAAVRALRRVAATEATVLLLGESGTGKEVAARAVHDWSPRAAGPFVAVNCAALSESLLESELFGHEKGAFTGAAARRRGRLELADGGTFFLDEIGELKPALQVKLLRVIQERLFERVGGNQAIACNVRWIAATNRDLEERLRTGEFREDLYHRLAVFPVRLPPLRERREDIVPLARALLTRIGAELGRPHLVLAASAEPTLAAAAWPGNVRQLANTLERAAILTDGLELEAEALALAGGPGGMPAAAAAPAAPAVTTMADMERAAIQRALVACAGNRRKAAELLGIGLRTLYDKIARFGLE